MSDKAYFFGLFFQVKDAGKLADLAARCKSEGFHPEQTTLFQNAADATVRNEPLRVLCKMPAEAHALADGFVVYGISKPTVMALSGSPK